MKARGFTLIELIMVIVLTGIIAASLTVFMKPAIDSYFDMQRRGDLTDMADTALRQISQDIRRAVPNSVILHSASCIQLAPTIAGGRYRMAPDIVNAGSATLDTTTTTSSFDVLTPLRTIPAQNDWVVIDNQNGSDVYNGSNRGQINTVTTPSSTLGQHRIALISTKQFPIGYDGGRFVVVANAEQSVFYNCTGGKLYRTTDTFSATSATCAATTGALVATDIASCTFTYATGATQQSGLVWLQLQLSRSGESVTLAHGTHIDNVP